MKKKTSLLLGGIAGIVIIVIFGAYFIYSNMFDDTMKFKRDYESLNGTIRESDGMKYNDVDIPKRNPIKYVTAKEVVDIIKNEDAIIYFGANWCPWCRNAVQVLFEAAEKNDLKTIYYLDMDTAKNTWEIKDGKAVKTEKEKDGYYELLDVLKDELPDYVLTDKDGKKYDTGEKRIYMPFVIAVKNGEVVDRQRGTVTLDEGQTKYDEMTTSQEKELASTYDRLIKSLNSNVCSEQECA